MIEGQYLAIADAIAHGAYLAQTLSFHCERCRSPSFYIDQTGEEYKLDGEELLIERRYVMRCCECGAIEGNDNITVIPSWVYHPMRDKLQAEQEKKVGEG